MWLLELFWRPCATSFTIPSSHSFIGHYTFRPNWPSSGVHVEMVKDSAAHFNAQKTTRVVPTQQVHWRADCDLITSYKHSSYWDTASIVARFIVFTGSLPSNNLTDAAILLLRVFLGFCGSTVLAWSKYATIAHIGCMVKKKSLRILVGSRKM
jgi:hypothetical protein